MNQKGFNGLIIVLGLAVVGLLIAGVYYFSKSPIPSSNNVTSTVTSTNNETANWQTYTRGDIFEINHPTDVKVLFSEEDDSSISFYKENVADPTKGGQGDSDQSCCGLIFHIRSSGAEQAETLSRPAENVIIAGYAAVRWKDNPEFYEDVWIPSPNGQITIRVSIITANEKPELRKKDFEVYKKMLETFKFLTYATSEADGAIDWKTYSNGEYGFSVKYSPLLFYSKQILPPGDIFLFQINFGSVKESQFNYNDGFSIEVTTPKTLAEEVEYRKWQVVGHLADKINKETDIIKDGYKGARLEYTISSSDPTGKKDFAMVIIKTDRYIYTIESNTDLIDQILVNFKILN